MHLDVLWLDKFELFLVGISLLVSVQTPLVGSKICNLKFSGFKYLCFYLGCELLFKFISVHVCLAV